MSLNSFTINPPPSACLSQRTSTNTFRYLCSSFFSVIMISFVPFLPRFPKQVVTAPHTPPLTIFPLNASYITYPPLMGIAVSRSIRRIRSSLDNHDHSLQTSGIQCLCNTFSDSSSSCFALRHGEIHRVSDIRHGISLACCFSDSDAPPPSKLRSQLAHRIVLLSVQDALVISRCQ